MSIDRPTFATTRLRTGYDPQQVDLAVDMILDDLALPQPGIGPGDLADLAFSTVSYRLGYDIEQVDDWLGDVSDELARRAAEPAEAPALGSSAPAPTAYAPVTRPDAVVELTGGSSRLILVLGVLVVLSVVFYVLYA